MCKCLCMNVDMHTAHVWRSEENLPLPLCLEDVLCLLLAALHTSGDSTDSASGLPVGNYRCTLSCPDLHGSEDPSSDPHFCSAVKHLPDPPYIY